ncbi:MAG: PhzF family phenazine biosynthesis protein [bacterium]
MPKLPFMQVDAFTDRPLAGNPCAIVFDTDALDDATMQAIAKEQNLSETAFVRRSGTCDFGVRYFTPGSEIPLAGHPTIATSFALVDSGRFGLAGDRTPLKLELKVGPIDVDLVAAGGAVRRVVMTQLKPKFLRTYPAAEVLEVFGLKTSDALGDWPMQTVSTGTPQLMVPLSGHDALRRATFDIEAFAALCARADFFSVHLFCPHGVTREGRTFARHFAPPPGAFEDPFTGSATGGMAAYLWKHGLLDAPTFVAEQGHWMARPGKAYVEVLGPREDIEAVRVGGAAVTVVRGEISF